MATPPFSLSTVTPGDSDIVSQFPLNERTLRDIIQSWILTNHDTNGNHPFAIMPWQSSTPATPGASLVTLFADAKGRLKYVTPDGVLNFVGLPPASVHFTAASATPVGYLVADGSAVSRSTFADLFTAIGTTYGSGDGSTTFNLPDIKGRVIAGEDGSSTRLSSTYFGATPTLGAVGGLENFPLLTTHIPAITSSGTNSISVTTGNNVPRAGSIVSWNAVGGGSTIWSGSSLAQETSTGANNISVNSSGTNGTPHRTVQPTIILRAMIKI